MTIGRTIKIYLENGSVTGIRHSEIVNWSGQAVVVPRTLIKKLKEWEESQKPGIYFLFGVDDNTGKAAVYIGESENVLVRLLQHLDKAFWNEAILFTSKDDNLTKSHIKYLESKLIELAKSANRYLLVNGNDATQSLLPRSDRAAMDEFLGNVKLLLGALGHKTLEQIYLPQISSPKIDGNLNTNIEFTLKGKVSATALYSNEGFIVKRGSKAKKQITSSLADSLKLLKEQLVAEGVLVSINDNLYNFEKDYLFTSSSQAAAIILGCPTSGPKNWLQGNMTLSEYEKIKE